LKSPTVSLLESENSANQKSNENPIVGFYGLNDNNDIDSGGQNAVEAVIHETHWSQAQL